MTQHVALVSHRGATMDQIKLRDAEGGNRVTRTGYDADTHTTVIRGSSRSEVARKVAKLTGRGEHMNYLRPDDGGKAWGDVGRSRYLGKRG